MLTSDRTHSVKRRSKATPKFVSHPSNFFTVATIQGSKTALLFSDNEVELSGFALAKPKVTYRRINWSNFHHTGASRSVVNSVDHSVIAVDPLHKPMDNGLRIARYAASDLSTYIYTTNLHHSADNHDAIVPGVRNCAGSSNRSAHSCTSLRRRQCPKIADPAGHQRRPQTLVCTASQAWPKMSKECLRTLLSHGSSILKNIAKRCCFENVVGSIGPTAAIFVDLQLMHECENGWRSSVAERLRLQYQLTAGKCLNFLAVGWRRRGCHNRTPEADAW
jgi:hypothetical protein